MTDGPSWQPPEPTALAARPPGAVPPPPPLGPPRAGSAPVPPVGAPQIPGSAGSRGWTPPPRPGLVPLHPMTLGTILSGSFRMLRRDPRSTLAPALLVSIVTTGLAAVAQWFVTAWSLDRLQTVDDTDYATVFGGTIALSFLASGIPLILAFVATAVLQGVIVIAVARAVLGERATFAGILRRLRGRIGALIGWAGLALLAAATLVSIGVLIVLGLGSLGEGGLAAAVALGVLFSLGGVVLAIFLSTRLLFVPQALVVERLPLFAAVRRSWALTRGFFWRTLGIVLLVNVIVGVATNVVVTPITFVVSLLFGVAAPTGGTDAVLAMTGVLLIVTAVVTAIAGAFGLVLQTATAALLYLDVRMRKEGLDLQLARFVEARQRGEAVPDPFPAPEPTSASAAPGGTSWS
jgi:hypothetical protein